MRLGRQISGEQPRDPGPAELARWQTDSMQYDEIRHDARRTFVEERG
jgi:hypothetical protein